jgi:hypothetical protein
MQTIVASLFGSRIRAMLSFSPLSLLPIFPAISVGPRIPAGISEIFG